MRKKIKILTVVGTRPNFIKIAPLFEEFKKYKEISRVLIHTGQHYDFEMSNVFFRELKIPKPDYDLNIGSGSHAQQTARVMLKIEKVFIKEKPDLVIVVGDVNSSLAGALTAVKLHIPVAHIEAGQRSFDREMPEEINRILIDHISELLFVSTEDDRKNLLKEGIDKNKIFLTGNIMTDALLKIKKKVVVPYFFKKIGLQKKKYAVLTLHRAGNVDKERKLKEILEAILKISEKLPIVFPIHPRTKKMIRMFGFKKLLSKNKNLIIVPPLSYFDMIGLVKNSKLVLTDSGGLQHETTVLNIPCLTVKETTEWPITVEKGTNLVVGRSKEKIIKEALKIISGRVKKAKKIEYWDGKTSKRIAKILLKKTKSIRRNFYE